MVYNKKVYCNIDLKIIVATHLINFNEISKQMSMDEGVAENHDTLFDPKLKDIYFIYFLYDY